MSYDDDDEEEETEMTCMEAIENEFLDKYPLTSRRHEVMQFRQPRGTAASEFYDKVAAMCTEADLLAINGDELIATLMICNTTGEELKGELMKIENPTQKKVKEEAKAQERKRINMKKTADVQKAYTATSGKDRQGKRKEERKSEKLLCWSCGNEGHRSRECNKKKEDLFCKKCNKKGHIARFAKGAVPRGKADRPGRPKKRKKKPAAAKAKEKR